MSLHRWPLRSRDQWRLHRFGARRFWQYRLRPFLFFVNAGTGRGNLIYCRYDGHYGLISPAA